MTTPPAFTQLVAQGLDRIAILGIYLEFDDITHNYAD